MFYYYLNSLLPYTKRFIRYLDVSFAMTEVIEELADELEEYGSSRADFRNLSQDERERIAGQLVIARAQARAPDSDYWDNERYVSQMIEKRVQYSYEAGKAGLDPEEARAIWWNCVYEEAAPCDKDKLV